MIKPEAEKPLSPGEINSRLQATLRGAFAGSPTPLKEIPKKSGEPRQKRSSGASAASAKTVSPDKKKRA